MPELSRRVLIGTLVGAPAVLSGVSIRPARAADYATKYANNLPATHPLNLRAQEAAERIARDSNGRMSVEIFPNNQLGGDTDMMSQVRSGAIDFFTPSALVIATLVPVAAINAVGFVFSDYNQVWAAMDGGVGGHVRAAIGKVGLHALEKMWDNGFRQTTTGSKPIETAKDFAGIKIRVPVSPLSVSMFKALGASPTSLQFSEVYSSLQTKIVDAQENPLAIIQSAKLFEVQKYCSMTNHIWDGFWMIANGKSWNGLPPDLKEIASRHLNEAGERQRDDVRKLNETLQADLAGKGLAFNKPGPDSFRAALRDSGFYGEWKGKFGDVAWGELEKVVGKLA